MSAVRSGAWHLFDHFVGAREQSWRDIDTELFRCLEIDDQLELDRLHNW
jgi:hypothetical protein